MPNKMVIGLLALAAFSPLPFTVTAAQAQHTAAVAAPRIDGFDVEPVERSQPGSELVFTLYGSPGATVAVRISGATGSVSLAETEAGVYEGSYTIRQRDQITDTSIATANLRLGNRVASAILDEPLIGRANRPRAGPPGNAATAPAIARFEAETPARLEAGEDLMLRLVGSPGGTASAKIAGVKGKIVLNEVSPGEYEGFYTIRSRDRIAADTAVTANLRIGTYETNAILGRPLSARAGAAPAGRMAPRTCGNCGTVEAINVIEVKGEGSYLGKIAGGVAGALLGSQVGQGRGTTVAEVAGAAGGVYAGNEIEKRMKTASHYEVVVRLENGGSHTFAYAAQPGFAVGTHVRVDNGALTVVR